MTQVTDRPAPSSAPAPAPRAHQGRAAAPAARRGREAVRSLPARLAGATTEPALSAHHEATVASGASPRRYACRHPLATAVALVAVARLPRRVATLSDSAGGRALLHTLTRPGPLRTPFGTTGVSVLDVPADAAAYSLGASKQTVRRKVRASQKRGVTVRPVDDPAERRALLARANEAETVHLDDQYRNERPDNSDLLDHDLWLTAVAADGTPLLLSVTPTDGEWGQLRYFRTLGSSPEHSDCRYLATQALVETLSARGVRHLVEGTHPSELPNGLRHFQRMVGFRLARVSARRA